MKRTMAGVAFHGGSGFWATEDGRYEVQYNPDGGVTDCECVVLDFTGDCPRHPGGERTYSYWTAWDTQARNHVGGDPTEYETAVEAAQAVASAIHGDDIPARL